MRCVAFKKESYEETKGPLCHQVHELDELRVKHTASQ